MQQYYLQVKTATNSFSRVKIGTTIFCVFWLISFIYSYGQKCLFYPWKLRNRLRENTKEITLERHGFDIGDVN